MDQSPIPDLKTMCHRTGFTKTCRECVVEHGCRLWKRVTLEGHPETAKPVDHYDCADSLVDLYLKDMLRRQLQTTATVDHLRKEVHQANDVQMVGAIAQLNNHLHNKAVAALPEAAAPKLIEST